jgi:DNA-binding HxlR family transcriptional regulator
MPPTIGKRKSYAQFCGLARALDVVGDRWTLLVIRELLVGPGRYRDLLAGLPGIATNLLSERLRMLERDGLIERRLGPEPHDGTRYGLTARGEALREVIHALVRWSTPLMTAGAGDNEFRPAWLAVALPALVSARPARAVRVGVETRGEHLVLEVGPTAVSATPGLSDRVDATLQAEPDAILGLAAGALSVRQAVRRGARATGDRASLDRVFSPPSRSRR